MAKKTSTRKKKIKRSFTKGVAHIISTTQLHIDEEFKRSSSEGFGC